MIARNSSAVKCEDGVRNAGANKDDISDKLLEEFSARHHGKGNRGDDSDEVTKTSEVVGDGLSTVHCKEDYGRKRGPDSRADKLLLRLWVKST